MKKHLSFIFMSLFVFVAISVDTYADDQDVRCGELKLERERLEAAIKKSKSNYEKLTLYKKLLKNRKDAQEIHCSGEERSEIKEVERWIAKLTKPNEESNTSVEIVMKADQDTLKIDYKHSKGAKVLSAPEWLSLLDMNEQKVIVFSAENNRIPHARMGTIEVEDAKRHLQISVTQEAAPLQANVTEYMGFGQDGGTSTLFVETNDTAWSIFKSAKWLTAEETAYGAVVNCEENPTKSRRSSKIQVQFACGETRDIVINQAIGRTTLSVPNKSFTFDHEGGKNDAVTVNCNYDLWSATPNVSWVKVRKKYGGISIECLPNKIAEMRTASVKVETNDEDHLVEYILVRQNEAPAYLSAEQYTYQSDGYERNINVKVTTNIPNWQASVKEGGDWTTVREHTDYISVRLKRNDRNSARSSMIQLHGKGERCIVSFTQPNRGYIGRMNDYYEAKSGNWHLTWISMDMHALTTIGNNLSFFNVRWKPVEVSLLNLNLDYIQDESFSASWEPIVRGYVPISRDGKWAAFIGLGGHVCMTGGGNSFLFELGADIQWSAKRSSRIFLKYNGGLSLGMSLDIGTWR